MKTIIIYLLKQFILFISILLFIASLGSCRSTKHIEPARIDTVYKQSIVYQVRDTTVYVFIPADTVKFSDTVLIREGLAETPKSRLDTKYSYSIAYVFGSKLYHNLYQKESEISATIKAAIKDNSKIEYIKIKETLPGTVTNHITGLQWFQIWAGRILLLLIIIVIAWRFIESRL